MLTRMTIQVDLELKAKINYISKLEGKNAGKLIEELFEEYVRKKYIGYYIGDLWERIGKKMSQNGVNPEDVIDVVHEVRNLM